MFFSSHQSHRKNRYSCLATHVQKEYGDRRKYIFSHSLEKGDIAKKNNYMQFNLHLQKSALDFQIQRQQELQYCLQSYKNSGWSVKYLNTINHKLNNPTTTTQTRKAKKGLSVNLFWVRELKDLKQEAHHGRQMLRTAFSEVFLVASLP